MITQAHLDKFKKENSKLYYHLVCLTKHLLVGFEQQRDMDTLIAFLNKNNIEYENNNRFLIWLPELSDSLKKHFKS